MGYFFCIMIGIVIGAFCQRLSILCRDYKIIKCSSCSNYILAKDSKLSSYLMESIFGKYAECPRCSKVWMKRGSSIFGNLEVHYCNECHSCICSCGQHIESESLTY
jgi:hypothetical protein